MAAEQDAIVAKLGSTELRQSQLRILLDSLDAETRKQLADKPAALSQLVRSEVIRRAVLKEAMDKRWDQRPEVLAQIAQAREQAILSSYMNDVSRPGAAYPSDTEIRQFYDGNQESFAAPARYRLAQIYIPETDKTTRQPGKNIEAVAAKAAAKDADFAQLAKQHSQHKPSADAGGDMGWLAENTLIPELRDPVASLKTGETSKPIRSTSGWHILKLLDRQAAGIRPLAEVREAIRASLRLDKARQIEQEYLQAKLKQGDFTLDDAALKALVQ